MRRPCNDCPWRTDAPAGFWHPDHFVQIYRECQDDGTHIMQCHKAAAAPPDKAEKLICQGWVRVMGFDAIGVRLAAIRGLVTPEEVNDRGGPPLFKSFEAMMRANGVPIPPRNQVVPIGRRRR